MKKYFLINLLLAGLSLACVGPVKGQDQKSTNWYAPDRLSLSLNFHAIGMPFKDATANFKNIGVGIGLRKELNQKGNLLFNLQTDLLQSRYNGKSVYATGNLAYAPKLFGQLSGTVSVGTGAAFHSGPNKAWHQTQDGNWVNQKNSSVTPVIGLGAGLQYKININHLQLAPTIRYQSLVNMDYNTSIPVLPQSLINIGSEFIF